ncbi:MAG TPA: ABC transporter substrate binding protein [Syntrophales bacterium]|nr:ABC transporter substrate binding protein [Syntrophales bacterium]HPQ44852.1 ABC transporter substrate binding protein [Syntrophales bacterium]
MIGFEKLHASKNIRVTSGLLAVAVCMVFLCANFAQAQAAEHTTQKVAVLLSRNIRPYAEAVEGMGSIFTESPGRELELFYLDKYRGKDLALLSGELAGGEFRLFISVGPEATRFIWTDEAFKHSEKLYSVVLNPEKVLATENPSCGISLNIPVQKQIEMIGRGLPGVRRMGLLYDPGYNTDFFNEAINRASSLGIRIVPLAVSSKKEIPSVLDNHWGAIDALWLIPDRTVISESIVKYTIKESLFKAIPVIGYNRFFYESGAALAFVFNYEELGKQCAMEALRLLSGEACGEINPCPCFHVWVNTRVMKKLGLMIREDYVSPVEVGP